MDEAMSVELEYGAQRAQGTEGANEILEFVVKQSRGALQYNNKQILMAKRFAQTTSEVINALACYHCFNYWQNQTALKKNNKSIGLFSTASAGRKAVQIY